MQSRLKQSEKNKKTIQYGKETEKHTGDSHHHHVLHVRHDILCDQHGGSLRQHLEEPVFLGRHVGQHDELPGLSHHGHSCWQTDAAHRLQAHRPHRPRCGLCRHGHPVPFQPCGCRGGYFQRQRSTRDAQLPHLSPRRLCLRILCMHAQHRGQPHAQHPRRRWQPWQPAHSDRWHPQLAHRYPHPAACRRPHRHRHRPHRYE